MGRTCEPAAPAALRQALGFWSEAAVAAATHAELEPEGGGQGMYLGFWSDEAIAAAAAVSADEAARA